MDREAVTLHRHNLPSWTFEWDDNYKGLVYRARKNIYKLFFENPATSIKPIWIGVLVNDGAGWVTWEKEIKAKCIEFIGSRVFFGEENMR